jgi:hypothetical protein
VRRIVATRGLVVEVEAGPVAHARGAARRAMATETEAVITGRAGAAGVTAAHHRDHHPEPTRHRDHDHDRDHDRDHAATTTATTTATTNPGHDRDDVRPVARSRRH